MLRYVIYRTASAGCHMGYDHTKCVINFNFILHCNRCDVNKICIAGSHSRANRWFTLTRKFTFKGMSPTNHFCMDR